MSVGGKREGFERDDLLAVGKEMSIKGAGKIVDEIVAKVAEWPRHAREAGLDQTTGEAIGKQHRLHLGRSTLR